MNRNERPNDVPRFALVAAAVLIVGSISAAGATRLTGGFVVAPPAAEIVESRDLRFADRSDRGIDVIDAASGAVVAELAPGTHGFIRGMMRGLSRDRRVHRVGPEAPFTLARWSDGRYSVTDPSTGNVLHLAAFGFANVKEFADLLPAATATASLGEREVRR